MSDKCEIVLLTPPGRGAVATLLVQGSGAAAVVSRHFHSANRNGASFLHTSLGRIAFGKLGDAPSEEIVACRTAEDRVELNCHGGRAAAERIVALLSADGCRRTEWTGWLESPEQDLLKREAAEAIARATTQRTANILLDQHQGALRREIESIAAATEGRAERIKTLCDRSAFGLHLTLPWQVVVAGRPNVGKSSLVNALLGYRRAIVFDRPGTTRDLVTAATALDGWPVELSDTAGLHDSDDPLEQAGMTLARASLSKADCVLFVFDGSHPWTAEDERLLTAIRRPVVVHNKADLGIMEPRPGGLCVSAASGVGLAELIAEVVGRLVPKAPGPGSAVPFTPRQSALLMQALPFAELADDQTLNDTPELRAALRQLLGGDFNSPARQ